MKRNLDQLQQTKFDLLIIGGGITGACIAHDAALRGLNTALVERQDFGMFTSAASSKLLHGGIRYLQKLQLNKVRESAQERTYFQIIAPHITNNIEFIVPTEKANLMQGRLAMTTGMSLYRLICSGLNKLIKDPSKQIPFGKRYAKEKLLTTIPLLASIDTINGAHTLYETHMYNSERMTLAFLKTAAAHGAVVANHTEVIDLLQASERVAGAHCRDTLSGKVFSVRAAIVVNAAGPFLPSINKQITALCLYKNPTGFSKGVHLVTRQIEPQYALALSSNKKTEGLVTRGGRHIFIIPWRNRSLIGTTNVPFENRLDKVCVTRKDIDDFLQDINAIIPSLGMTRADVHYAFAGLYPLISDEIKKDTYQKTGEYQVVDHARQDQVEGIISVLGAKHTTARKIAQQATDLLMAKLQRPAVACTTMKTPLFEGQIAHLAEFEQAKINEYAAILEAETIRELIRNHGSNLDRVIDYCKSRAGYLDKLSDSRQTLVGEIGYAVDHEMACTLSDVVFARTGLGTIGNPGETVLNKVVSIMAEKLLWEQSLVAKELASIARHFSYQ